MLNEKRVKHMVKLAFYDSKDGAEEIKINSYSRKDYVNYNVLRSLLWTTLGYIALVAILCLTYVKGLVKQLSTFDIIILVVAIIVGYVFSLIFYGVISVRYYKKKHYVAKGHVKKYLRDLDILEKMYESEETK